MIDGTSVAILPGNQSKLHNLQGGLAWSETAGGRRDTDTEQPWNRRIIIIVIFSLIMIIMIINVVVSANVINVMDSSIVILFLILFLFLLMLLLMILVCINLC